MKTTIFLLAILVTSCSHEPKLPKTVNVQSVEPKGTTASDIKGPKEYHIKRKATIVEGFMTSQKSSETGNYNAHSCVFGYEKGSGQMNETSPEFKFETLSINMTGTNAEEETSFERISYTNVDFTNLYKEWNFTESFGPIFLDNSAKFGTNTKEANLEFIRKGKAATMILKHTYLFDGGDSSFFNSGELRKYITTLNFAVFTDKKIILNNANVKVIKEMKEDDQLLINVDCLNFKTVNE
ncbi:MAG: hypothetical protein KC493_03685 [Bacteriovoracaceae bacterium]|nr:hypothetical protein [Bacteriovoracaceae bacterium]